MDFLSNLGSGAQLKKLDKIAKQVNLIEDDFKAMSDAELRAMTDEFRRRLDDGEDIDKIMPEAFAVVREATVRVVDKRLFDVQIMGGAALHWGNIAEMKTGEGKTHVGTLPAYLNALTGKGVHVVTTNDYLAKYQSEQMGRIHHFLGLTVDVILSKMTPAQRREAYKADITYGTNNEFGFDYLRDNMALKVEDLVQRGHHYAIVDEVDSILVDEARTPLIISGPAQDTHEWYPVFAKLVRQLERDRDYEVDEKKRTVAINASGIEHVEDRLGIDNLYESANTPLISYLNNAIKAKELFKKDKDYVVMEGEILIVDEHTGRSLSGRRYNEGLHQALEAKEGVQIRDEYQTLATVTLQNYFRMYDKLAGMTGTAKTEESEFQKIYGLGVIQIPTNRPMIRQDRKDLVYRTEEAKYDAIIADVVERHAKGQPVLIGTASVAKSELLSKLLKQAGIPHNVLNAKQHQKEAEIVAQAGRKGAVTVSTNMAGRGTDIMLGGNPEFLADLQLRKQGLDPVETPEEYEAQWPDTLQALEDQVRTEHEEVVEAGGLYVIGSERHESRRIDNQLRGRSGRQGDPGESRFYLSLSDDLMRLFRPELLERALLMLKVPDDVPIENKSVTNTIESAQKEMEARNFEMRKNVLKYDDVMNRQRHVVYRDRRRVLDGADLEEQLRERAESVVAEVVRTHTVGVPEDWDIDMLLNELRTLYPVGVDADDLPEDLPNQSELIEIFTEDVKEAYDRREEELGADTMRELERQVLLSVVDRNWREHLYEMDYLREGIGLRAMAQRDPLVEYQREGGDMFIAMREASFEQVVGLLFNLEVNKPEPAVNVGLVTEGDGTPVDVLGKAGLSTSGGEAQEAPAEPAARKPLAKGLEAQEQQNLSYSAPDESGEASSTTTQVKTERKLGRNQPCFCGSGKKYKNCHGGAAA
ncbi:preprotein translocase subunit SecA [Tessaracoccus rhinocerotis]|uniref:Protein translocase subunit SecA n=1 Tax=Tessaracoccus rhinocerotis TaxID=1689449 RepID=A0A553K3V9_9ACTN|nr:preprotein translocase subunit SecA [Tessaracoccus rhinocerotis]TRY19393.1 preprotein translocase subunit SecA [Tessaracoccus rhinocerotis]